MARGLTCDVCRKPIDYVEAKLMYVPANGQERATHSHYSHHADLGPCCASKVLGTFNFHKRMTRAEYMESRKNRGKRSVAA